MNENNYDGLEMDIINFNVADIMSDSYPEGNDGDEWNRVGDLVK